MLAQTEDVFDWSDSSTADAFAASKERSENLASVCESLSGNSGVKSVDDFVKSVKDAATTSIDLSNQLGGFYYRQIGETKDGVTDVVEKKPSVKDCLELSGKIAEQSVIIAKLVSSAADITSGIKSEAKNPVAIGKATKAMASATNAAKILGEESAFQVKAIANMVETAKSANNL